MLNIVLYYSPEHGEPLDIWHGTTYADEKAKYAKEGGKWHIKAASRRIIDKEARKAEEGLDDLYPPEEFIACLRFDGDGAKLIDSLSDVAYVDPIGEGVDETVGDAIEKIAMACYKLGIKHGKEHAGERKLVAEDDS